MLVVFTLYMVGVALLDAGRAQDLGLDPGSARPEPRRARSGCFQPVADGVKNLMKEETLPADANKWLFILAPMLAFIPAHAHLGRDAAGRAAADAVGTDRACRSPTCRSGYLFMLAISSLGVYGIVLAGWASNNKYALLGGLRSSAQMISYEIAMGMSTIPILLLAGNVSLNAIIDAAGRAWAGTCSSLSIACVHLPGGRVRRDQPAAVRPAGGGVGAGRRLPHRVQRR